MNPCAEVVKKAIILCLMGALSISSLRAQLLSSTTEFENEIKHQPLKDQVDTLYEISLRPDIVTTSASLLFAKRALEISFEVDYKIGIAKSYYAIGEANKWNSQFEESLAYHHKSLNQFNSLNEQRGMMVGNNSLCIAYTRLGQHEKSLKHCLKALKLAEALNLQSAVMVINNNVGVDLNNHEKYEQAKVHLEAALAENPPDHLKQVLLNNLGISWEHTGYIDKAINYYHQSLDLCKVSEDSLCEIHPLNNLGSLYEEQLNYDKAIECALGVVKKLEGSTREQDILILSYTNLGSAYTELGYFEKAIDYLQKALQMADEIKSGNRHLIHLRLSKAYEKTKQHLLSLEQLKIYWQIQDSIQSIEKSKQIEGYLAKYQSEKKEKEIALLKREKLEKELLLKNRQAEFNRKTLIDSLLAQRKENEILGLKRNNEKQQMLIEKNLSDREKQKGEILLLQKEKELKTIEAKRQSLIRKGVIIGAILLLIPALILIFVYQQKVKSRELLHTKTEEINRQKTLEIIRDHELKATRANIEGQEKEKQRISSDLHDGISGNLAGIKLTLSKIAEDYQKDKRLNEVVKKIDNTYKEVRTITHQLTPPEINNDSFNHLIKTFLKDISSSTSFDINFICHPPKKIDELSDDVKIETYRIIQELINNIIKHALSDHVEVQLTMNDDSFNLLIEDNGVGFDITRVDRGIGLTSIKSRVTKLKGKIDIDSNSGRGTIVNIDIPISKESIS